MSSGGGREKCSDPFFNLLSGQSAAARLRPRPGAASMHHGLVLAPFFLYLHRIHGAQVLDPTKTCGLKFYVRAQKLSPVSHARVHRTRP